jgi:NADPH:quinone reductase-like Zn-dependent oxidoreductase
MTVRVHYYGGEPMLEQTPEPTAGFGEVVVRVMACGVNPADWKRAAGDFAHFISERFPINLGSEFSGEIVAVGAGVAQLRVGDEVFGMTRHLSGAYSTSAVVAESDVCLLPASVSHHEASGVPVAALTAFQALHEQARIRAGQRVLVHGAAGGVGGFAVQLARLAGAEVLGTASAANLAYVLELGSHL